MQVIVLWICADDFTPDACGAYGRPLARTPNLDRLAAAGVRLDRAFASPPAVHTGRAGVLDWPPPR